MKRVPMNVFPYRLSAVGVPPHCPDFLFVQLFNTDIRDIYVD